MAKTTKKPSAKTIKKPVAKPIKKPAPTKKVAPNANKKPIAKTSKPSTKEKEPISKETRVKPAAKKITPISPSRSTKQLRNDVTLVTKEGLQKMIDELIELKEVELVRIANKLKEAVAQGDLSENAEYAEAKDQQNMVNIRIAELEQQIRKAEIIKKNHNSVNVQEVTIGCEVIVVNISRGKEEETYTIVGSIEANPLEQKISNQSPLGSALLGCQKGDEVKINAPAGEMIYKILKVN